MESVTKEKRKKRKRKPKWVQAKIIIGIISMVLFGIVIFQSCAAGLGNALSGSGEMSGTFGFVVAFNLLVSGIIAVVARKSVKKTPWIIATCLLWLNYIYSRFFSASFGDLIVWGFISFSFGTFYLLSAVRKKKGYMIAGGLSVLVLLVGLVFGGGSSNETGVTAPSSVTAEGQSAVANSDEAKAEQKAAETSSVTIEEAVLLDQAGIKISVKGMDLNGWFGPEIKMLFENNSSKSVTIQARDTSVNGYMIEPMLSVDVPSGKSTNDSLTLLSSDLQLAGITTIADIELVFHIFETESWDSIFDSDTVRIETSASNEYQYTFNNSGNRVYHEKGIEIVVKGLASKDSLFGKEIIIYIHNESNTNITIQARDTLINGFMVDPVFSCDVAAGKHAVDTITFMDSELEKNGIQTIENVEITFHIFNESTMDTIADTPTVTMKFN